MKPTLTPRRFLLAALLVSSSAHAAPGTWLGNDGNWGDTSIWSGAIIADGIDSTATFTGVDIATNRTITLDANRTIGNITFTDTTTSSNDLTISGANILTLDVTTAPPIIDVTQSGRTLTISSEIAGSDGLQKNGAGILALTGVNTYTGITTINAGTLSLNGGNDRLATTGTVNFSGSSTLSIANNQTLSSVTVADDVTGTINGGGGLTLNGSSFIIGNSGESGTQTLNLSGLSAFTYTNAAGAFSVAGRWNSSSGSGTASTGIVVLPATTTITALIFGVGDAAVGSGGRLMVGTLTLGTTATINANTIAMGNRVAQGTIQYSSVTNPTLTIRATNGSSAVSTMSIGDIAGTGNGGTFASLVDLATGVTGASTLDALITTLTIGRWARGSVAATATIVSSGELRMGGGTLTATTIFLGQITNNTGGQAGSSMTGTMTVTGGTVRVNTLTMGSQNSSSATAPLFSNFNLNGGAHLYAQTIDKGGSGTQPATRTFNWNDGTIHNLNSSTDLTINNNLTTFALLGAGAHTFDIDNGRQGTVNQVISGAGALTKAGSGMLTLTGDNSYTGATAINGGTLTISGTGDINQSSGITVASGATLRYNSSTALSVSTTINNGGAIGGSGTLGNLTINSGGDLDLTGATLGANSTGILSFSGATLTLGQLTFLDLVGWDWANAAAGTYELVDGTFSIDWGTTSHLSAGTAYDFGNGRSGYFTSGSLTAVIIPEPHTVLLGGLGALLLLRRRRA